MGKVSKFTGSKLLGAELRRLRGGRTLKQVAELSRSEPLCHRVRPISAPTLSQIETGVSFPTLESVYTLASIYQVSAQSLLDAVAQERIAARIELPEREEELEERYVSALHAARWNEGLSFALQGERCAKDDESRVLWRARRANCLKNVGMRLEAMGMLMDCLEEPCLDDARRARILRALAEASASAGHLTVARVFARQAVGCLPTELPASRRWPFVATMSRLVLLTNDRATQPNERELRETVRELEAVKADVAPSDLERGLLVDVFIAVARRLLGNLTVAERDLVRIVDEADKGGHRNAHLAALANLGLLRLQRKAWAAAKRALTEAAFLAVDDDRHQEAFEIHFELYRLAERQEDPEAEKHLRACERFFPFVQDKTPNVRSFQTLARDRW